MILEALVTTTNPDGTPHLAPMGPRVEPDAAGRFARFTLRPFATSHTRQNLRRHPEGVLHVSDDAMLFARAAVGAVTGFPPHRPAVAVEGFVLAGACRIAEFRVTGVDESAERVTLVCEVAHAETLRDFFGFNRAKHAVIEAAILATRLDILPHADIAAELRRLRPPVEKTGGPAELEAFAFLAAHCEAAFRRGAGS